MLLDFLSEHIKTNHRDSTVDGVKHVNSPTHPFLASKQIGTAVYIYDNPIHTILSLFRRGYQLQMVPKLTAQHRTLAHYHRFIRRNPYDFTLEHFINRHEDAFGLRTHWKNWREQEAPFPIIFVKYTALFEQIDKILGGLSLDHTLVSQFPACAPRQSTIEILTYQQKDKLNQTYGPMIEELNAMLDIFIKSQPKTS